MSSPAVTPVASPSADMADLAGAVRLSAGGRLPTIASSRPELTPRLAPGKSADQLPELLAALHSLCSQAHRLTARRAVAAARDRLTDLDLSAEAQALRLATARDQLLRIVHDWPRQLPGATPRGLSDAARDAASALLLRACPLWRNEWTAEERLADLPDWLAHALLGQPVAQWLEAHDADPQRWAMTWARDQAAAAKPPLMARLLASQLDGPAPADALIAPAITPALPASDDAAGQAQLRRLGACLVSEPGFWAAPHLNGAIPDTGPWSRHRGAPGSVDSAWARLVARAADLLRLAGPEGGQWLNRGALTLSPGEGIAWTEMARGLLIHWVKLDATGQTVEACRVLAPTEWNFHRRGVLAQALAGLSARPADERRLAAQRLAVAFDPCVAFSIVDSLDAAKEGPADA
ncbi:MAG: nickel-dependent hydrogenase large subunit [Leptothrix sp. (in: Bacteria)]|jgi:hypothetical protein|nr:nickel-dependent hydrogenase large subunit [Leptothrix sp. (in: b-proteobacteria)]MBP7522228.1 nickel-dependent hydrogenase large subunit [Leptothrix sp. (in: b-proteobacteria)]